MMMTMMTAATCARGKVSPPALLSMAADIPKAARHVAVIKKLIPAPLATAPGKTKSQE